MPPPPPPFHRGSIVGIHETFPTPFPGQRRTVTYADWTASGRAVSFVEEFLTRRVLPTYGNSHTEDDLTGSFSTHLLHDAERIIKECVNAGEDGKVIEIGTGATGAIVKLQEILGVFIPPATRQLLNMLTASFLGVCAAQDLDVFMERHRPVVFVGPYEHHSNEVSWRQGFATVVEIAQTADGNVDLEDLEKQLQKYGDRQLLVGSFCAGSNVTGLLAPVHEICRVLHAYGAIACFDYAAAGPYVDIDMNPEGDEEGRIDAIFLSPHKFLGGPGSCGLLVFNSYIYDCTIAPSVAAGGTVAYVSPTEHDFVGDIEEREKAGTPGMLQVVRAALALDLKRHIGVANIHAREKELLAMALGTMDRHPNISILGNTHVERLGIISFNVVDPRPFASKKGQRYLHHKFVTVLLNDLFGIQSRGGCSCAGPLGHRLLHIDPSISQRYRDLVVSKHLNGLKPGWARIGMHYTMTDAEAKFLVDAIVFVADRGSAFLRLYSFDPESGKWSWKGESVLGDCTPPPRGLHLGIEEALRLEAGGGDADAARSASNAPPPPNYQEYLAYAHRLADQLAKSDHSNSTTLEASAFLPQLDESTRDLQFFNVV